jgi:hypothetical protein
MTTIPYDTAFEVVEYMREQADKDHELVVPYEGPLPPEVVETLHMVYHFALLPFETQPHKSNDDVEQVIFQVLGHEWVFKTLLKESFTAEFYNEDVGHAEITKALEPYRDTGVPVELVTALLLVFSATYSSTTICILLGMGDPR